MVDKPITNDDILKMLKISKDVDPIAKLIELAPTLSPKNSCFDTAILLFELFATRLPNSKKIQNMNDNLDFQFFSKMMGKQLDFHKSCLIQIQIQAYGNLTQNHYVSFYRQAVNKPFTLYHSWIDSISLKTWCSRLATVQKNLKENLFTSPRDYIQEWLQYWLVQNEDMDELSREQVRQMWVYMGNQVLTVASVFYRWPK